MPFLTPSVPVIDIDFRLSAWVPPGGVHYLLQVKVPLLNPSDNAGNLFYGCLAYSETVNGECK